MPSLASGNFSARSLRRPSRSRATSSRAGFSPKSSFPKPAPSRPSRRSISAITPSRKAGRAAASKRGQATSRPADVSWPISASRCINAAPSPRPTASSDAPSSARESREIPNPSCGPRKRRDREKRIGPERRSPLLPRRGSGSRGRAPWRRPLRFTLAAGPLESRFGPCKMRQRGRSPRRNRRDDRAVADLRRLPHALLRPFRKRRGPGSPRQPGKG